MRVGLPLGFVLAFAAMPCAARADGGPSLTTLAAASDRPAECTALSGRGKRPSIWRLSRRPSLGAYCDQIARAHALLETDPRAGLAAAQAADTTLADQASTFTAIGRADLALGDVDAAVKAFEKAQKLDGRSLDEPKAMNDFARALVLAHRAADAAPLYRALVPRAGLLPDRDRPLVFLRAAHALMAHAAAKPDEANADLADAAAYLAEARTDASSSMLGEVLLSAALVFDRSGDADKASATRDEAGRAGATFDGGSSYLAVDADKLALQAMLAETNDPSKANAAWQKYLDANPTAAFAKAAKNRLTLPKGTAKRPQ
jgi:tetratricopeptide (TPR) repeat protein